MQSSESSQSRRFCRTNNNNNKQNVYDTSEMFFDREQIGKNGLQMRRCCRKRPCGPGSYPSQKPRRDWCLQAANTDCTDLNISFDEKMSDFAPRNCNRRCCPVSIDWGL